MCCAYNVSRLVRPHNSAGIAVMLLSDMSKYLVLLNKLCYCFRDMNGYFRLTNFEISEEILGRALLERVSVRNAVKLLTCSGNVPNLFPEQRSSISFGSAQMETGK